MREVSYPYEAVMLTCRYKTFWPSWEVFSGSVKKKTLSQTVMNIMKVAELPQCSGNVDMSLHYFVAFISH